MMLKITSPGPNYVYERELEPGRSALSELRAKLGVERPPACLRGTNGGDGDDASWEFSSTRHGVVDKFTT